MTSLKARFTKLVVLFGIAAVLTVALNLTAATDTSSVILEDVPLTIGNFVGRDIPVEQFVKDILETPNVLMREYVDPGGMHVTMSIVYYEQYRVYFHMPEGCMTGRGSVIIASEREQFGTSNDEEETLTMNKLMLKQDGGNEHVFYIFVAGDTITPSYPKMRYHLMREHLKRRRAGAALVRFSTMTTGDNEEETLTVFRRFIGQAIAILPYHLS